MSIFAISDLHLCDKGARDNFNVRGDKRLYKFLDYVDKQGGELYVLGDLLECWQCNFSASVVAYYELLNRLNLCNSQYVFGNHDNVFAAFESLDMMPNVPFVKFGAGPFTRVIGDRTFLFCHGHEADATCRDLNPGVGAITAIMSGMLEDRNNGPNKSGYTIEDAFISSLEAPLNLWRHLSHQSKRRDELIDGVETYRERQKADVVVYGHTHEQGRIADYHYNCGTWARDRDGFTRIEDDGTLSMWTWDEDHAESFDKELR